jgi:diketogulonate reductase-like aldo/keto reductase
MEALHDNGQVRLLGISNVSVEQVQELHRQARIKPRFVQNRCYAVRGWDRRVRQFCAANGVIYQGFSLLTANPEALVRPELLGMARRYGRSPAQIVFRFAFDTGMIALTGTTRAEHMRDDLEVFDFRLEPDEVARIEGLLST